MMWFVNAVLHYTALLHGDRFALAMRIPLMQFANAAPHCTAQLCGDHAARVGICTTPYRFEESCNRYEIHYKLRKQKVTRVFNTCHFSHS